MKALSLLTLYLSGHAALPVLIPPEYAGQVTGLSIGLALLVVAGLFGRMAWQLYLADIAPRSVPRHRSTALVLR